jgi:hypothetical protein
MSARILRLNLLLLISRRIIQDIIYQFSYSSRFCTRAVKISYDFLMKLEDAWNVDASTAKTCVSSYSSGLGRIFQPMVCRLEFILDLAQKVNSPRLEWRQLTLTNSC